MPSSITLGLISFSLYGIIISFAVLLSFFWGLKTCKIYQLSKNDFYNLFFIITPLSIFFSRLYHVLANLEYYQKSPIEIINLRNGGLGFFGALFGGLIAVIIYSKLKKINFFQISDFLVPLILIVQIIGRWGNWVNQEAFGPPTDLPWKIAIDFSHRPVIWQNYLFFHPVFLYESLFLFFLFLIISKITFLKRPKSNTGLYLLGFGVVRFFIEIYRFDTATIYGIKTAQIFCIFCICIGLFLLKSNHKLV